MAEVHSNAAVQSTSLFRRFSGPAELPAPCGVAKWKCGRRANVKT